MTRTKMTTSQAVLCAEAKGYSAPALFQRPSPFPKQRVAGILGADEGNVAFTAVRDALAHLGLDRDHFDTPQWNPLGGYIRPGDKVVIKPNLVLHEFGAQAGKNCLTTHGSVLRAVVDYVYLAAGPEGRITIADAPLQGADFESIVAKTGLREIQQYYRERLDHEIEVIDLRQVHAVIDESSSLIKRVERLPGDPRGYCEIDLGPESSLRGVDRAGARYVVGDYDVEVTNERHRSPRHTYLVSRTVLDADAIISVPKLKTHSKAGLSVCLKNMVGIIGSKDCLPHHRHGKVNQGGDEFPADYPFSWLLSARLHALMQGRVPAGMWRASRRAAKALLGAGTPANGHGNGSKFFPSGGWHGNDTIWRTVDDLNRILYFYDPEKQALQSLRQRRYFAVVDGIVGMEGNGPLRGTPKPAGVILAGDDPLALDVVAATLMGFDWHLIRMLAGIARSRGASRYSAFNGDESSLEIRSNHAAWRTLAGIKNDHLGFVPPAGWREFVETQRVG